MMPAACIRARAGLTCVMGISRDPLSVVAERKQVECLETPASHHPVPPHRHGTRVTSFIILLAQGHGGNDCPVDFFFSWSLAAPVCAPTAGAIGDIGDASAPHRPGDSTRRLQRWKCC